MPVLIEFNYRALDTWLPNQLCTLSKQNYYFAVAIGMNLSKQIFTESFFQTLYRSCLNYLPFQQQ